MGEMTEVIRGIPNCKGVGLCSFPAELFKLNHLLFTRCFTTPVVNVCRTGGAPHQWKYATVMVLLKNMDNSHWNHYRVISLVSLAGRILYSCLAPTDSCKATARHSMAGTPRDQQAICCASLADCKSSDERRTFPLHVFPRPTAIVMNCRSRAPAGDTRKRHSAREGCCSCQPAPRRHASSRSYG